jgi:hypothetical protein
MQQTVKWLPKPENHDYLAAEDYLRAEGLPDRQREEGKDE